MGKNKKRFKGNTRPSSSMHSAELLSSTGAAAPPGLIGFQNYPVETTGLNTAAGNLEEEGNSSVRVIVKTMLKKDVVTKLKGIQEFISFCTSDKENAKLFLPYFPRIYNKLAIETHVCVRESIQKAAEIYIPMMKKDVAPYLKSIMGTWLITQCDPCVGAARGAQLAFWKSFPSHKRSNALMFCQSEILKAITDNLSEANEDSVNEACSLAEDANREKHEFNLVCSIRGMKLLLSLLSKDDKSKMIQPISLIVHDKQFWVHSQSPVVKVRGAWYELLHTLISEMPEIFEDRKYLISLVVSSLWKSDNQNAHVLQCIWDCAMKVFSTFKDWWSQIDVTTMVFTPLLEFLSRAGHDNAEIVYPMLKDFLGHLMVIDNVGLGFYVEFFSSIRESLCLDKLKTSPRLCDAVMKAFVPCLKLVNTMYLNLGGFNCITELLERQLFPLINYSWMPEGSHIRSTPFFPLLGLYLFDLEIRKPRENFSNDSAYCILLTYMWERIYSALVQYLNEDHLDVSALVLFFHCLHQPLRCLDAEERKANLCDDCSSVSVDGNCSTVSRSLNRISGRVASTVSSYSSFLFKYTVELCEFLCVKLEKDLKICYLDLLTELISEVNCSELYTKLVQAFHIPLNFETEAALAFFKSIISCWMQRACTCNEHTLDWITEIIIYICLCVDTKTGVDILENCCMIEHQKIFQRLVLKILGSAKGRKECFLKWFNSLTFGCTFEFMTVAFTRKLMSTRLNMDSLETSLCWRTLMLCFTKAGSEQPEVPWNRVQKIVNYLTSILSDEHCVNCEFQGDYNIIDFICDVAKKLLFEHPSTHMTEAEIAIFMFEAFKLPLEWAKFSFPECHKEQLQLDCLWKMYIPHAVAVINGSNLHESNFLVMVTQYLHDLLLKEMPKEKQKCVTDTTYYLLSHVAENCSDRSADNCEPIFIFLIKKILPTLKEWEEARNGLCMGAVMQTLQGKWFYPFLNDDLLPLCSVSVPPLLFTADAVATLLRRIWDLIIAKCSGQIQGVYLELLCSECLPHLLWAVCYTDTQNFFKSKDAMEPMVFSTLQENFSYLMEKCNMPQFVEVLFYLLLQDELTWGIPFEKIMQVALKDTPTPMEYCKTFYSVFEECRKNHPTLTQICLKYSRKELIWDFLNSINEDVFNDESVVLSTSGRALCAFASQLARCVEEHGIKSDIVIHEKVTCALEKLAGNERFRQYDHGDDPLLITCFTSIAVGVLRDAQKDITDSMWLLLIKVTTDLFQRCLEISDLAFRCSSSLVLVQQTCKLICIITEVIKDGLEDKGDVQAYGYWKTLFESDISKQLVKLFFHFAGKISDLGHTSSALESLLHSLVQSLQYLSTEQILEVICSGSISPSSLDLSGRIDSAYRAIDDLAQHLKSRSICVQFGMHFLLRKVLVYLPKIDQRQNSFDNIDNGGIFRSLPLLELLEHTNEVVEQLLTDVKPSECRTLKPFTASYTYTMANLLAWNIVLEYLSASVGEERSIYMGCLADSKMLSFMLMNAIRLRPENPSACLDYISRKRREKNEFSVDLHELPPLYSLGTPSSKHLQHVACSVYVAALKSVPVLVRTWWSNLDMKTADIVEKFTSDNISKTLIMNEIGTIHSHKDHFANMMVDAYASSRQVTATYTLDEATIELSIKISQNHPLGPVLTSTKRRNIIDSSQWRTLMFHLSTSLNYHNGSIKDGLLLWKKNLDKMFEGVEECMICYFILHTSGTIPNKTCRICKKKFHGSCLFKWFKSSNSCSCPGCRNIF